MNLEKPDSILIVVNRAALWHCSIHDDTRALWMLKFNAINNFKMHIKVEQVLAGTTKFVLQQGFNILFVWQRPGDDLHHCRAGGTATTHPHLGRSPTRGRDGSHWRQAYLPHRDPRRQ